MIYCVVPQALADELYDKLADYYRDDPHVEVIIDRRAQGGSPATTRPTRSSAAGARRAASRRSSHRLLEGRGARRRRVARQPGPCRGGRRRDAAPMASRSASARSTSARPRTTWPSTARCCWDSRLARDLGAEEVEVDQRLRARRLPDRRRVQGEERRPEAAVHRSDGRATRFPQVGDPPRTP